MEDPERFDADLTFSIDVYKIIKFVFGFKLF